MPPIFPPNNSYKQRAQQSSISKGVSEFGEQLASLLELVPGALAAVLSDSLGETIDTARRGSTIDELDTQLTGAQLSQCMKSLRANTLAFGWGSPVILLEAQNGSIIAAPIGEDFLLTLRMGKRASLGLGLRHTERAATKIEAMLA